MNALEFITMILAANMSQRQELQDVAAEPRIDIEAREPANDDRDYEQAG